VAISDLILKKADRLSPEEFATMKSHTYLGARLFRNMQSDFEEVAAQVALNHHEKWDGTGYPRGLKEDEIPIAARIFAVADVWEALTHDTPFRKAWNQQDALNHIVEQEGRQFDPHVVAAFIKLIEES
jgi:putative two-component system response regulator